VAQEPSTPADLQSAGRRYPPVAESEPFWPAQLTVLGAIGLQLLLPERLTAGPSWLVPSVRGRAADRPVRRDNRT